jgi:hypothetical protein
MGWHAEYDPVYKWWKLMHGEEVIATGPEDEVKRVLLAMEERNEARSDVR